MTGFSYHFKIFSNQFTANKGFDRPSFQIFSLIYNIVLSLIHISEPTRPY